MESLSTRTRGQMEAEISQAMIRFQREFLGRGPLEARTYLIDDMALVRLRGVLSVAEQRLAALPPRGAMLVRQLRLELLDQGRALLAQAVSEVVGVGVRGIHSDFDPALDE